MRSFLTLATMGLCAGLWAQCPFTPTITPAYPILCSGESALLSTQEYDSYQCFHDGQPIDGAMRQTLAVDYFSNSGCCLSVLAEQDACSELSTPALVQGWVFLLPYVIHEGDKPVAIGPNGDSTYCAGGYTVRVFYEYNDQVSSEPYLSTDIIGAVAHRPWTMSSHAGQIRVSWEGGVELDIYWSNTDVQGRSVRNGFMPMHSPPLVDLAGLPDGVYLFQAAHRNKALAPATRFTLMW